MAALSAFARLVSLCCLWAALCFAVYSGVRLFGRRFRTASNCFGSLAFALLGLAFGAIAFCAGLSWDHDSPSAKPYPLVFVSSLGVILLVTLGVGGWLMRQAAHRQLIWWHGVLLFSFYLVVADGVCWSGLIFTGASDGIGNAWDELIGLAGASPYDIWIGVLSVFLIWIFPLGAPIAEIGFRSFRRALVAQREGHPA